MSPFAVFHYACWVVFLIYWIVSAQGNKKTVYRERQWFQIIALVVVVVLINAHVANDSWLRHPLFYPNQAVEIMAALLTASGVAVAIWARRTLSTNWSATPTIKEGHELITRGPYRFVRHPIYTGILMAIFGSSFLAHGRVDSLIIFIVCFVSLYFKLRLEERLMRRTFPDTYPAYMQRTKALIPLVL